MKSSKGYTLIELVVVAGLIVSISGFVAGVLVTTLRGGAKSKITNEISRSGNFAISEISREVINSSGIVSIGGAPSCSTELSSGTFEPNEGSSMTLLNSSGNTVVYECKAKADGNQTLTRSEEGTEVSLIDESQVKVISSCSQVFMCSQDDQYSPPVVKIEFDLSQSSSSDSVENIATSQFRTSATLRNFSSF